MIFRVFRLVVGLILGVLSAWLIKDGGIALASALTSARGAANGLVTPVTSIVGGLVLAGVYYYSLWAPSPIRRGLENIFAVPDLLKKIAFTLALLCIYRVGYHIPLPGIDENAIREFFKGGTDESGGVGQALSYFNMFTGGNLQQCTLFGLGIMPYISASIIFTLLVTVVPSLAKLQKEGPAGYRKIQEYTRYATVPLCIIQAAVWMRIVQGGGAEHPLVYAEYHGMLRIFLMGVLGLTAGTIFLMWLGEQIDEYGVGNGISLLIMAGIVARLPAAVLQLGDRAQPKLMGSERGEIGLLEMLFLVAAFISVVAGAILITQGQRRIPIQQAKHTRGRRVYGGQRQYMPLRVNHGGVMPIIFASALMMFPNVILKWVSSRWPNAATKSLMDAFSYGRYVYEVTYILLIFFFAYFWTTVQFRPKEMADQLRDMGHFIPGLRPGKRTADYLERVMGRITYCGAAFLAAIAVIPSVLMNAMGVPFQVAQFLGGTGLLIMVSVALDLVQRIEANLVMRNYGGFLGGSTRIKGAYS